MQGVDKKRMLMMSSCALFMAQKKLSQISDAVLQAIIRSFIASYVDETVQYERDLQRVV